MTEQFKNMIIGIFVIAALAIVVFILLFLHPRTGDEGQTLYVRFGDIDKINVGSRVLFAGKPVGEVAEIREIEDGRQGPKDPEGHIYVYQLKLVIDSGVEVYNSDIVTLRTSGLLGERSVSIVPLAPQPGQVPRLISKNEIIYGKETGSVEDTMKEFKEVADKFDVALSEITSTLQDIRREELIKKIADTAQNLSEITTAINKPDQLSSIIDNIEEVSSTMASRLPDSWDTVDEILASFSASGENFEQSTKTLDRLMTRVSQGKGTVGKLIVTDDLYQRMTSLFSKGEVILNDMSHYGLLYHLDKGWQRMRARRMNLLAQLRTPQEFRNYFNDEIDQISTSLSRVSMILDKVEFCTCYPFELGEDPEFNKVFSELMRRVEGMEESLKMYNQQLVDERVYQTELVDIPRCCN